MSAAGDSEIPMAGTTTPLNPDAKTLFAEFGVRMGAVALDLFIPVFVANTIGLTIIDRQATTLAVMLLYFSLFWSSPMRATPVQYLFGMRVVDEMGETLSLRRAILRGVILIGLSFAASKAELILRVKHAQRCIASRNTEHYLCFSNPALDADNPDFLPCWTLHIRKYSVVSPKSVNWRH